MYTEGHITKVTVLSTTNPNQLSFALVPLPPYLIKNGALEGVLVMKDKLSEGQDQIKDAEQNNNGYAKINVDILRVNQLTLQCPTKLMDFAALAVLKTSHARVAVEFNENTGDGKSEFTLTSLSAL